jgi:hypothetical protein
VRRVLAEVIAIPDPHRFLEERMAQSHVRHLCDFRAGQHNGGDLHVRLDHDVGTQRDDKTIRLRRSVHVHGRLLRLLPVQYGSGGVDVGEEEVEAAVHQARGQQALGTRERGGHGAPIEGHVRRKASGELGIALVLTEFGQDFGAASLGALLLRDGIVGAGQAGGQTVLAGVGALADALHFAAVAAGQDSKYDCRRMKTASAWRDSPIAGSLNGSGCGTDRAGVGVGGHDEVTSDWTRLSSSRGEGNRRAGPVVLIVYLTCCGCGQGDS